MNEYTPNTEDLRRAWWMDNDNPADNEGESDLSFDRAIAEIRADAWDEGAKWAAVEAGAIRDERNAFLAPGDNPYRAQRKGADK